MADGFRIRLGGGGRESSLSGCVGRGFLSLFFLVFIVMGSVGAVAVARATIEEGKTRSWTRVPCTILSSGVAAEAGSYPCKVEYRYVVAGREYTGTRIALKEASASDASDAQVKSSRYVPGTRTECFVNPEDPSVAVLETPSRAAPLIVLFPLLFVAIGVGGILFAWRAGRPRLKPDGRPVPVAISAKASKGFPSRFFLPLFFGLFFLVGLGALYPLFVRPVLKLLQAKEWRAVDCSVISSEVRPHHGSDSTTYSVDILYSYEVSGREYRSNRYDFMGGSSSGYDSKSEVVGRYPPGSRATCFVNPEDPQDVVLNREFQAIYLLGLIPLVFVAVGLGGLAFSLKKAAPEFRGAPADFSPSAGSIRMAEGPGETGLASGPVTLRSKATPLAKFVGITLVALFWNGILSIFLYQVVASFVRGNPEWFLTLFMVPFVIVGAALVGGIGYQFLALFNPRIYVTLQSPRLRLGDRVGVDWEVTGSAARIRTLTLRCVGREEATYTRGTNTSTDKSVFARIPIAESGLAEEIARGRAMLEIPRDLVPTFGAAHNKIAWFLHVHGDIPRWPDLDEEFELTVLPRGGAP